MEINKNGINKNKNYLNLLQSNILPYFQRLIKQK